MNIKIYSHHLYEINNIQEEKGGIFSFFYEGKDTSEIDFIFHSENCFSVKNKEGKYLTAFLDKKVTFFATKCSAWERFYILDIACQKFIENTINNQHLDARERIIENYELFLDGDNLQISLGSTLVTPSYIPMGIFSGNVKFSKYKTYKHTYMVNKKRSIIYFCIYGKDEYYQCFELALKSLILLGEYSGDILIKTDNIEKVKQMIESFGNQFYFSEIDKELGIFNRYWLYEEILNNYDSIIYLDCDILTINPVKRAILSFQEGGDFLAYQEVDNKKYRKEIAAQYKWWGANYLVYNNLIKSEDYFLFNSGFFVINNLQEVKPVFQRVIEYRGFENKTGDQPWLNLALYNCQLDIKSIELNHELSLVRNISKSLNCLGQTWIHFNIGVGNTSKLNLMKNIFNKLS